MWIPLQVFGVAPFRAALDDKLLLTRYCYQKIQQMEGMEVGHAPERSVLFFRYIPEEDDPNIFNQKLVDAIHEDGRVFLSSTHLDGTVYLRLAILSFRTHLEEIELMLKVINEMVAQVK